MSPMTTLLSAAKVALPASEAQSAPAAISPRMNDFIPFLPNSRFVRRRAANAPASCGHNAWRRHAWQLLHSPRAALGALAPLAYKSTMARKESRQAKAARTEAIFERLAAANP